MLFLSLTLPLYENVHYMASAYENLLIIGKSNLWSGEDPDREAERLVMAGMALLAEVFLKKLSFYLFFFFFFLEYDPRKTTYSSCCAKCSSPENWLSLICLTFWAYLLLGSRSGRETIQKAWRQEEINALLAGFLCLKPAKKSFV